MAAVKAAAAAILFIQLFRPSYQHGRLMEPPSRASMWRVGFPTPRDQDDNQSYCGGYGIQFGRNEGKCGVCGDSWDASTREHEAPYGMYANGIITKTYKQGSLIPVIVDITANHQGHFEFKICPNNDIFLDPDQGCFEKIRLSTGKSDEYDYPINDYETGLRLLYVRLPLQLVCEQCILQWTYIAGNNWGNCPNGTSGLGCGNQEHFRSCADIKIVPHPLLKIYNQKMGITSALAASKYDDLSSIYNENIPNDVKNTYEELAIDFVDIADADGNDAAAVEQKELLLRKKKIVLEKVLEKLKNLILETSNNEGKAEATGEREPVWNTLEDMRVDEWNRESRTRFIRTTI